MFPLRSLLTFSLLTQLASGCEPVFGGKSSAPSNPSVQDTPLTDSDYADQYFVADPSCQADTAAPMVTGSGIKLSFYNFYEQTPCSSAGDPGSCGAPVVLSETQELRVCSPTAAYPRTSVEGVGHTSLLNLEAAANFYTSLPTHISSIAAASLLVLPRVENFYADTDAAVVTADNLAYAASFRGNPTFLIYPKGQATNRYGIWRNVNFWEVPWTLAHEYGHHIFHTHAGIGTATSGVVGDTTPLKGFPLIAPPVARLNASGQHFVMVDDLVGAVNEGFADLYAYYVYGSKPGIIAGFDCFQNSRDAGIATFGDGEAKTLSTTVLAALYAKTIAAEPANCSTPNYQDVHMIGAIYAYAADQIFSATAGTAVGTDAAAKKAAMLLGWANFVGESYTDATGGGSLTLGTFAHDILRAAAQANGGTLPQPACDAAKKAFPTYLSDLALGAFSCK